MTNEIKAAIKRICNDYGFCSFGELRQYVKSLYGDNISYYWFSDPRDEDSCYIELENVMMLH